MLENITWHGHASFAIGDGQKIYFIDPFELKAVRGKADIIFITHAHFDHCSIGDIKKIMKSDTVVVAAPGCAEKLNFKDARIAQPNASFAVNGIGVRAIPAYNVKPERLGFHPRRNNWLGYVIEAGGKKIYHAGDTDFVPEMKTLGKLDVAMLPIGGTYTMDVNEAIEAARAINAGVTAPMHYRRLLGEKAEEAEEKFLRNVKGAVVMEEMK